MTGSEHAKSDRHRCSVQRMTKKHLWRQCRKGRPRPSESAELRAGPGLGALRLLPAAARIRAGSAEQPGNRLCWFCSGSPLFHFRRQDRFCHCRSLSMTRRPGMAWHGMAWHGMAWLMILKCPFERGLLQRLHRCGVPEAETGRLRAGRSLLLCRQGISLCIANAHLEAGGSFRCPAPSC